MSQAGAFLPVCDPSLGWVFGCSRRGASHVRMSTPCQDAYGIATGAVAGSPYVAIALADGHGGEKHDLSQGGAALAVRAALEEMQALVLHVSLGGRTPLYRNFRDNLPRAVIARWRKAVLEDAQHGLGNHSGVSDQSVLTRYGTTLLAALLTSDLALAGRLGDGDILLVKSNGEIECPFPDDPTLFGSETHSLSSFEAEHLWQSKSFQEVDGGLLFLATDGLGNAFSQNDHTPLHKFATTLKVRIAEYGIDKVSAAIPRWLDELSQGGSDDDITLALFLSRPAPGTRSDQAVSGGTNPQEKTDEPENRVAGKGPDDGREPDHSE